MAKKHIGEMIIAFESRTFKLEDMFRIDRFSKGGTQNLRFSEHITIKQGLKTQTWGDSIHLELYQVKSAALYGIDAPWKPKKLLI